MIADMEIEPEGFNGRKALREALALLALRREASRRERANMKVPPTSGTTQCDGNRIKRLGSDDTSE